MSRYLKSLACLVCVLALAGNVQGAWISWDGEGADSYWITPENWSTDTVPATGDICRIDMPGAELASDIETQYNDVIVGFFAGGDGGLTVKGGSLNCGRFEVGGRRDGCQGTITMMGGTINCSDVVIGRQTLGIFARMYLYGGTINTKEFSIFGAGSEVVLEVRAGKLVMDGTSDNSEAVDGVIMSDMEVLEHYIDIASTDPNRHIYAYQGWDGKSHGELILTYDEVMKKTTLTAVHDLRPSPADAGIATPTEVTLSWTLPDPCVPGTPMPVDVYFTDDYDALYNFTDPAAIQIVNQQNDVNSISVSTVKGTRYYWEVDVDRNGDGVLSDDEYGVIFSFVADNVPPMVSTDGKIDTVLVDGTRTGPIAGVVTDDGYIVPGSEGLTTLWSIEEQPDPNGVGAAVIADANALETTITLSAAGEYILKLVADDGEYTGEAELIINAISDDWLE